MEVDGLEIWFLMEVSTIFYILNILRFYFDERFVNHAMFQWGCKVKNAT